MSSRAVSLYRSLLRAHKNHLPKEMRQLGDAYIKSEFKLHKNAKPEHLDAFFQEWEKYLEHILVTARTKESLSTGAIIDQSAARNSSEAFQYGKDLPKDIELDESKKQQLDNLRKEAEKYGRHQR